MSDSFTVIGGDSRFLYTAAFLREKGHKVNHIFYDGNGGFKIYNNVILPVPALKNGFLNAPDCPNKITAEQLFGLLPEKTTVYAGMINDKLQSLAEKRGARLYDYYRDEAMLRENALLTAKAVLVLLGQKSIEIGNGKIFILGFGRCGKALYRVLTENGGCVTVVTSKKPKCDFISFDEISERIHLTIALMGSGMLRVHKRCKYQIKAFNEAVYAEGKEDPPASVRRLPHHEG